MSVSDFFGGRTGWLFNRPVVIPLRKDGHPFYTISPILDGSVYEFGIKYAAREDRWYLTIMDGSGRPLVAGIKMIADWPLLRRFQHVPGIPPGNLMVQDTSGHAEPPGAGDWAKRCRLLYSPITPL